MMMTMMTIMTAPELLLLLLLQGPSATTKGCATPALPRTNPKI